MPLQDQTPHDQIGRTAPRADVSRLPNAAVEPRERAPTGNAVRVALAVLLTCAGYYVGGIVGIALRFEPGGISGIWLPHGILVASLLLTPMRQWWLFVAALLPAHLHLVSSFQGPVPLPIMLVQYGGNMAQAMLGAVLVRSILGQPPRLRDLYRMGAFIVGAAFLAGCVVSAIVAWLFTINNWVENFAMAWERRVLAQACGAVIIGPLIIDLAAGSMMSIRGASRRRIIEFLVLTIGVIAVVLAFSWLEDTRPHHVWLLFAPLPLLLWSAVRFAPAALGLHLLVVACGALLMTRAGRGPFAAGSSAEAVLALQGFLLAVSIPLLMLAALVQQHRQASAALRRSQAHYRSVVEDQSELICRLLPDGTFTFVNGAYCRYFQRSPEQLIGQSFWQFLPPEQHDASRRFLDSITPDQPVATIEHRVLGPGDEVRWQQWTDRGFFDAQGRLTEVQAVGRDVTDQKRMLLALAESEELHRVTLSNISDAVFITDEAGVFTYVCPNVDVIFGYTPDEVHAKGRIQALLGEPLPNEIRLNGHGEIRNIEHQITSKAGERRTLLMHLKRVSIRGGTTLYVCRDITDRKHAEEEHRLLESHRRVEEALREADHRKDEFLAMLGHELRNPLAPIGMAAEILRARAPADDTIVWAHDVITRQVRHLTRLVDDLLDVSRITRGKINLNMARQDLGRVIRQAIETSRPLIDSRHHELVVNLPNGPLPVHGDNVRLTQVISNLLHNAAKYTDVGGRIELSAERAGSSVKVTIVDNGVGIPPNMLDRVFDMFMQIDSSRDRAQGGLGIGLTLVRRLVEMHNGTIEARSGGPAGGSVFTLSLPLAGDDALEHEPAAPPIPALSHVIERKRILIVDDNVDAAESLLRMFKQQQQHEVRVVHDGLAALAEADRMKPDIVLLDIGLPKMDGLEVARRLKHRPDGPPPLLVATTGFGQAEDRLKISAAGFDHHLVKPIDPLTLQMIVQKAT